MNRGLLWGILTVLVCLLSPLALAQQSFDVLIDTDNNALTGCTVDTPDGPFTGAEQILSVTLSTDTSQIEALSLSTCSDGSFGAPQPLPGPPIPVGTNGISVLEFAVALAELGDPSALRLGVISLLDGEAQDALLTRTGQAGGPAMLLLLQSTPPRAIPTLGLGGLLLLVTLFGALSWLALRLRRHPLLLSLLAAGLLIGLVRAIELDGDPADWAGIAPLGTDPTGDGMPDLVAFFATVVDGDLVMRIDVELIPPLQVEVTASGAPDNISTEPVFTATFSAPVNVAADPGPAAFELDCGAGPVALTVDPPLPATATDVFTLEASGLTEGADCTLTVSAARISGSTPPLVENFVASFTVDEAPAVLATDPGEGATVALDASFTFTFSEPVTADPDHWTLECPAGTARTFTLNQDGGDSVTLVPDENFEPGAAGCSITIATDGVSDLDEGDPPDGLTAPFTLNFAVDAAPEVSAVSPPDGGMAMPQEVIQVTFSEAVDVSGDWLQLVCTLSGTLTPSAGLTIAGGPEVFTATPTVAFTLSEACTGTVFAALVSDQDEIDPPDNPVADFTWNFTVPAIAADDGYDVTPHLTLSIGSAGPQDGGLLANDSSGVLVTGYGGGICTAVTPGNATATDLGGSVTVQADGSFVYLPPAGQRNIGDSFCYTITGGDTATVTLALQNTVFVWFYQQGASGDGTQAAPFGDLAGNTGATTAGDTLFLADGSYSCGISLLDNQRVVGGASSQGLQAVSGVTPVAGSAFPALSGNSPALGTTNADCLTLAQNNTLRGFSIGDTGSGTGLIGTNFGTLTVSEMSIAGTGRALNLATGTLAMGITTLSSTSSGNEAVRLAGVGGSLTAPSGSLSGAAGTTFLVDGGNADISYGGTITQATSGQRPLLVQNRSGGTLTLSGAITATAAGVQGILLDSNTGGTTNFQGGLTLSTGTNPAFTATSGGTLNVCDETPCNPAATGTLVNTLTTTTATALNVTNTTIGANNLEFRSISSNGAANGIVLNNTGTSGGLVVKGTAAANSGGTIQNTTGDGVLLTNTTSPSFTSLGIQNTAGHGVKGTQVTNFSFVNGTIDNSGTALGVESANLAFNTTTAGTENNLSGVVTITGNTLTNAFYHGIDIFNFNGTIGDATISNNTITSSTSTASSLGSGIRFIAFGSAGTVANITRATIANNVVSNFPSAAGIQVQGGNANAAGPAGTVGTAGSGSDVIAITGNRIAGASPANRIGTQAILAVVNGKGQGNFDISGNGTVANPITNVIGTAIAQSAIGTVTVTSNISNNVIVANNSVGSQGIGAGTSLTFANTDTPSLTVTILNNTISQTDGNGILVTARDATGSVRAKIQNNNVAAPLDGNRNGIRVDAGNSGSINDSVCLNISGNTSAGVNLTPEGIGLRKQGTVAATNNFALHGLATSPATAAQAAAYVSAQNPASANGTLIINGDNFNSPTCLFP